MKQQILENLQKEFSIYQELDSLLSDKKKALMEDDLELMKSVTAREQENTALLKQLEDNRQHLLTEYCRENGLELNKTKFSSIFSDNSNRLIEDFRLLLVRVNSKKDQIRTLLSYLTSFNQLLTKAVCDGMNDLTYHKDHARPNKQVLNFLDLKA